MDNEFTRYFPFRLQAKTFYSVYGAEEYHMRVQNWITHCHNLNDCMDALNQLDSLRVLVNSDKQGLSDFREWCTVFHWVSEKLPAPYRKLAQQFPHVIPDLVECLQISKVRETEISSIVAMIGLLKSKCVSQIAEILTVFKNFEEVHRNSDYNNLIMLSSVTLDIVVLKIIVEDYAAHKMKMFVNNNNGDNFVLPGIVNFERQYKIFLKEVAKIESGYQGLHRISFNRLNTRIQCSQILEKKCLTQQLEGQCSICHAEYNVGDAVCDLSCGHLFHTTCIRKWLLDQANCPLCRKRVC